MAKAKKTSSIFRANFGKTINTPTGRLVFPAIARPQAFKNSEPKYSAMIVCRPGDKLNALWAAINEVGHKSFGPEFEGANFYKPILSGEEVMEKSEKAPESLYAGNFRLLAKGAEDKEPPKCYLADKSLMPRTYGNEEDLKRIEAQFYPGCYCRLAVTPFSFNVGNSVGVGLIFKGIQFIKDGERLGAPDLEEVFGEELESGYEFEEDEVGSAFEEVEENSVSEEPNL